MHSFCLKTGNIQLPETYSIISINILVIYVSFKMYITKKILTKPISELSDLFEKLVVPEPTLNNMLIPEIG